MFLTAPALTPISTISHGFFTRNGGVSKGIYQSLNGGLGSNDNREHVIENRNRIAAALGAKHLCSLYQVHSADVVTVGQPWRHSKLPKADAMVTKTPGIALGILTADCVPILFADAEAGVIGAAHSGWKGTLGGISQATVAAMEALGATRKNIVAAVGPAIAQQSYEVGSEYAKPFLERDPNYKIYFMPSDNIGHLRFNLKQMVYDILQKAGVGTINMLENDTYIEEDTFFSYRRSTHRSEPDYGRQISAIMLK